MDILPCEVLECIFKNLCKFKYLPLCKLVCRRFYQLIKDIENREIDNIYKAVLNGKLLANDFNSQSLQNLYRSLSFNHNSVHFYETTTCYHNKKIFIYGGNASVGTCFKNLWCFNFITRQWSNINCSGELPPPNSSSSLVGYKDHLVLFGGYLGYNHHKFVSIKGNKVYLFNMKQRTWKQMKNPCFRSLNGHRATMVGNLMIVFGGLTDHDIMSDEVLVLDMRDSSWHLIHHQTSKPPGRFCHTQELVSEDRLLVLSGYRGTEGRSSRNPVQLHDAWMLSLNADGTLEKWYWTRLLLKGSIPSSLKAPINFNKCFKVRNKLVIFARKSQSTSAAPNIQYRATPTTSMNIPLIQNQVSNSNQNHLNQSPSNVRSSPLFHHSTEDHLNHVFQSRQINHLQSNSHVRGRYGPSQGYPLELMPLRTSTSQHPSYECFGNDFNENLKFFSLDLGGMLGEDVPHVKWDEQVGYVEGSHSTNHYCTFVLCESMVVEVGVRDDENCISTNFITS